LAGVPSPKYAAMNVALGHTNHAVATGSELFSSCVQAAFLAHTNLPFEIEFLRWIVGDAAGAIWLAPQPAPDRLSLRIDRIEIVSFASESETCMYAGAVKEPDGSLQGWRAFASLHAAVEGQAFAIKQDLSLFLQGLNRIDHSLTSFCRTAHLDPTEITWFLPCYPSDHCRPPLSHRLQEMGFAIPQERWWTSFEKTGYTGAASLYVVLAELYHSGQLQPQDRIFCFVPESGRFSVSYLLLTVI
ncbi:MAG: hypothetical protein L7F78_07715, partial [Syntrophales bacterium LBB04]|nr:hypothetical protein [Syntrophales bacterium LBB04]